MLLFISISVVFPLETSFTLSSCSVDMGFLACPPNLKSFSSISHCPCSLLVPFFTLNPPLSRSHFESSLPSFSLFSLLSPFNENHVHFTHFELPTGASPYSTLLNCYTQILHNLIFLNICLPAVS